MGSSLQDFSRPYRFAVTTFLAIAGVFSILSVWNLIGGKPESANSQPTGKLSIDQLGRLRDAAATLSGGRATGWQLVEFGDYECPPCRRLARALSRLDGLSEGISIGFLNFPLRSIHPRAAKAAELAESYRDHPRFAELHDQLMTGLLDMQAFTELATKFGSPTNPNGVGEALEKDVSLAALLKVRGTPKLFLVRGNGDYWEVSGSPESLSQQIQDIISE